MNKQIALIRPNHAGHFVMPYTGYGCLPSWLKKQWGGGGGGDKNQRRRIYAGKIPTEPCQIILLGRVNVFQ
jgi:hypothetical protein